MNYVFMNEKIRVPVPDGPVIVVQADDGVQREANEFEIRFRGQPIGRVKFEPAGLGAVETHTVRAWVEFEDDVDLFAVAKASAKKPKRKVKVAK